MSQIEKETEPRHPIRVVAKRTGLTPAVLRAWERRYGAVEPGRSDGGQRLYSDEDIHRLRLLARVVDAGRNIGQVAEKPTGELEGLLQEDRRAARRAPGALQSEARASDVLGEAERAVLDFDNQGLERLLSRAALILTPRALVDEVAAPLLRRIGMLWQDGKLRPAQEHLASVVLRRFLEWVISTSDTGVASPVLLASTPAGHNHEFGALLAAAVGATEGWEAIYLGPDLPAEEIARAANQLGALAVALSAIHPRDDDSAVEELRALRDHLPGQIFLVAGGPGFGRAGEVLEENSGIQLMDDFDSFRALLRNLRDGTPAAAGFEA